MDVLYMCQQARLGGPSRDPLTLGERTAKRAGGVNSRARVRVDVPAPLEPGDPGVPHGAVIKAQRERFTPAGMPGVRTGGDGP